MKSYTKLFAPFLLAVLVGSLTLMFAQTKNGGGRGAARGGNTNINAGGVPGDHGPGGFGGPGGLFNPRLLAQLNLTDAQKTQIAALQETARAASEPLFEQLRAAHEQIKTATQNGAFNETQLRALLTTKANLQIELEVIRFRTDAGIRALLTAEQIALLEQLQQHEHDRFGAPPRGERPDSPRN